MSIFKRIKSITQSKRKLEYIFLFNKCILSFSKSENKKINIKSLFFFQRKNQNIDKIIYFKINRQADYSLSCIQHWVNAVSSDKTELVFVCDNKNLLMNVLRYIKFQNSNIRFIPSLRRQLRYCIKTISTRYWAKATFAHLTPFADANKFQVNNFWAIDADDTMLLMPPECVKDLLVSAENIAKENNIDLFSLDMWKSRTHGQHWSLGVVYIRKAKQIFQHVQNNKNTNWMKTYKDVDVNFNLDWFCNYLAYTGKIKISTFYPEGCHFIHWGDFIRHPTAAFISYWDSGFLYSPIMQHVFANSAMGKLQISDECIKIEMSYEARNGLNFLRSEVASIHFMPKEIINLLKITGFESSKYFL